MPPPASVESARSGRFHLPSLDGVRTLAFLLVFVSHSGAGDIVPGGFGVSVFFVLSGFLITSLMRRELEQTGTFSLRNFYLRRAARILPPMYIVLALSVVMSLSGLVHNRVELRPVLLQAVYLTNYLEIFTQMGRHTANGTNVLWSLAIEEHFYLIFPLLFVALAKLPQRHKALWLTALCMTVLAWRCALVFGFHVVPDRTYMGTDTRIDNLLWGCLLAVWNNPALDPPRRVGRIARHVVCLLCTCVLLLSFVWRDEVFRQTFRYSMQALALLPLFYFAVQQPEQLPFRWVNGTIISWVGSRFSYSLYLVHLLVLRMLEFRCPGLNGWQRGPLGLAICLALAALMYYLVERPCAALRKRLQWDAVGPARAH